MTTLAAIKERPILFSGPMIQAIQDNRKTMTRRIVKPQPVGMDGLHCGTPSSFDAYDLTDDDDRPTGFGFRTETGIWPCPYGKPGERLWVRETFLELDHDHWHYPGKPRDWIEPYSGKGRRNACAYRADCDAEAERCRIELGYRKWKPAIHMPRWTSRYDLELVSVRVERLQWITYDDIAAEGINDAVVDQTIIQTAASYSMTVRRYLFSSLWEKINGAGSWEADPWVWVIEFKRVDPTTEAD